jgi:ribosomal protein S19
MRSSWKGTYSLYNLNKLNNNNVFLSRNVTLTPLLINSSVNFQIYNGRLLNDFDLKGVGVCFKAGSFNFTKSIGMRIHTANKKLSKKK